MNMKLNWLGVVVATVAAYVIGWVWYGMVFEAQWMALSGIDPEAGSSTTAMALGFVQTLITMIGLGWLIGRLGDGWMNGLKTGVLVCVFFVLTTAAYAFIYGTANTALLPLEWGHLLVVYGVGGAIIGGLKMKPRA